MTTTRRTFAVLALAVLVVSVAVVLPEGGGNKVSATGGVTSISTGYRHTCVVLTDGGVKCWGRNDNGQLGNGTTSNSTTPVDVCTSGSGTGCSGGSKLTGIVDVAAGFRHTCARTASGGVLCWGLNDKGQLGDGTTSAHTTATDVCASGSGSTCSGGEPLTGVEQVDVGGIFSCALMTSTGIKCWGSDERGQLGIGTLGATFDDYETHPVDVCVPGFIPLPLSAPLADPAGIQPCLAATGFANVATGGTHACGLTTEGGAKCWGSNNSGRLGDGTEDAHSSPVDVCTVSIFFPLAESWPAGLFECNPVSGYIDIDAGAQHTCALTASGGVTCWGYNFWGMLGDGTETDRLSPVNVCASGSGSTCNGGSSLAGVSAIALGDAYTCAIAAAGDARCWGYNAAGAVGDGTTTDRLTPVAVSGLANGVAIIAGGANAKHACAGTSDGQVQCWGSNSHGQLGRGTSDIDPHPLPGTVEGFGPKATATPTNPGDVPTSTPAIPTNTPGPGTPTSTPPANGLIGDVDCSGSVTAIDAALILQFAAGLLGELPCPGGGDVNGDGNISAVDAALVLQFAAGLLGSLPP